MLTTGEVESIARELLAKVKAKKLKLFASGRRKRTHIIRSILHGMARNHGFKFHPYLTETRKRREFLCDFVWKRWHKGKPLFLRSLVLAVESEWAKDEEILYDFVKLMPVKASLKLCIYQVKKRAAARGTSVEYRHQIEDILWHYADHIDGEYYLLLELDRKEEKSNLYYWRAGKKGLVPRPRFRSFV